MKVFRDAKEVQLGVINGSIVALGTFDGVHIGHKAVLDKCVSQAKQEGAPSFVFTFYDHPSRVISPKCAPKSLTDLEDRLALFQKAGIQYTVLTHFDAKMARVTPREFIENILIGFLGVKQVIVGFNYTFGWKAKGNADYLKDLGKVYGFDVHISMPVEINGVTVSSTEIRTALAKGNIETASDMLGRPFSIKGKVIKGDNRGKLLGYPTVNLDVSDDFALPKQGVYAAFIYFNDRLFKAVTNIGMRPTFYGKNVTVETHILGFDGDLYGANLRVLFCKRLRDEKKFGSSDELIYQISKDIKETDNILNHHLPIDKIMGISMGISEDAS